MAGSDSSQFQLRIPNNVGTESRGGVSECGASLWAGRKRRGEAPPGMLLDWMRTLQQDEAQRPHCSAQQFRMREEVPVNWNSLQVTGGPH